MKARTICKRCHRLNPSGGAGYCVKCTEILRTAERRKPTLAPPAEPTPAEESASGAELAPGIPVPLPRAIPKPDPAREAARAERRAARMARRAGQPETPAAVDTLSEKEPSTARSVPDPPVTAEEEVLAGTWAPNPTALELEDTDPPPAEDES